MGKGGVGLPLRVAVRQLYDPYVAAVFLRRPVKAGISPALGRKKLGVPSLLGVHAQRYVHALRVLRHCRHKMIKLVGEQVEVVYDYLRTRYGRGWQVMYQRREHVLAVHVPAGNVAFRLAVEQCKLCELVGKQAVLPRLFRPVEQVCGGYLISLAGGEQLAEPLGKPGAILYPGEYPELAALLGYGLADGHAPPLTGKKA